jgi:very-short-patch-repair endonuclease
MKTIIYNPIHVFYNNNLNKSVHKRIELKALSYLYSEFKHYNLEFQYYIKDEDDNYIVDLLIRDSNLQISGVCIEIDEGNHRKYSAENDKIRENIIKLRNFSMVRIPINNYDQITENFMNFFINKIKDKINEQIDMLTCNISEDKLLKELEKYNISLDFYKLTGKNICNQSD